MDTKVTGMMMNYYFVCKKKLWYHSRNINPESENENVQLGKILDENSFKREKKHINIDGVMQVDFIKNNRILHEVKKSKAIEEASIWQLKLYLYYLKERKVEGMKGKIDYPLLRRSINIELTEEDEKEVNRLMGEIKEIIRSDKVPVEDRKKYCTKCSFYEICYI